MSSFHIFVYVMHLSLPSWLLLCNTSFIIQMKNAFLKTGTDDRFTGLGRVFSELCHLKCKTREYLFNGSVVVNAFQEYLMPIQHCLAICCNMVYPYMMYNMIYTMYPVPTVVNIVS